MWWQSFALSFFGRLHIEGAAWAGEQLAVTDELAVAAASSIGACGIEGALEEFFVGGGLKRI